MQNSVSESPRDVGARRRNEVTEAPKESRRRGNVPVKRVDAASQHERSDPEFPEHSEDKVQGLVRAFGGNL